MTHTKMYWLQAITPMQVGAGKGIGFIDMPIMREKVTNWPVVPGSAVKGVLRDYYEKSGSYDKKNIEFGFGTRETGDIAGSLVFSDAHIVCFPSRSLYGTYSYVTSPLVLERLKRDLQAAGYDNNLQIPAISNIQHENNKKSVSGEPIYITSVSKLDYNNSVFLEDLNFIAQKDNFTDKWGEFLSEILFSDEHWKTIFKERFAIISNDIFTFIADMGTDVSAHIRIDESKKTTVKGALWYEESLPAEAVLAGVTWCDRIFVKEESLKETDSIEELLLNTYCNDILHIQIGGKATVGKGRISCIFSKG